MLKTQMILLVILVAGCAKPRIAEVGDFAPSFELQNVATNQPVSLKSTDGRLTVLNFWSTSCASCLKELPDLNQLHEEQDALVIGIALDEDVARVQRVVEDKELSFEVALGTQALFEKYDGYSLPYTLILDRNQVIRKRFRGPVSHKEVVDVLNQIEKIDDSVASK